MLDGAESDTQVVSIQMITQMNLTLPATLEARMIPGDRATAPDSLPTSRLEREIVWVVDDTAENRRSALAKYGAKNEVKLFANYGAMLKALADPENQRPTLLPTDLMMPVEEFTLSPEATNSHKGAEFPAGMFIAKRALIKEVPRISLQTDTNHHDHPASAALDFLQREGAIQIGSRAITPHSARIIDEVKDWVTPLEGASV